MEIVLAVAAVFVLCALGCAGSTGARRFPASVFKGARFHTHSRPGSARGGDESALFVTRALQRWGLRFGIDGTVGALWGYLRTTHDLVPPEEARPGDVVFFDVHGRGPDPDCDSADHVGIVERITADGRIGFVEARGGAVRHSFVDPRRPSLRRDARGEVVNTFLRTIRITDPDGTRYFAGEMLCAVVRPSDRR